MWASLDKIRVQRCARGPQAGSNQQRFKKRAWPSRGRQEGEIDRLIDDVRDEHIDSERDVWDDMTKQMRDDVQIANREQQIADDMRRKKEKREMQKIKIKQRKIDEDIMDRDRRKREKENENERKMKRDDLLLDYNQGRRGKVFKIGPSQISADDRRKSKGDPSKQRDVETKPTLVEALDHSATRTQENKLDLPTSGLSDDKTSAGSGALVGTSVVMARALPLRVVQCLAK